MNSSINPGLFALIIIAWTMLVFTAGAAYGRLSEAERIAKKKEEDDK